ncbi:hypothetical protein CDAR_503531 [Caerostris darwini]|uniref:Uncharacterized protein n=1 Tax=Caerostris darwini TaxID=1538125 RepID=A0AAV4S0L0_9ARAC|nr:hypothetical protein CDAR_503531 [Caerostris darwini]
MDGGAACRKFKSVCVPPLGIPDRISDCLSQLIYREGGEVDALIGDLLDIVQEFGVMHRSWSEMTPCERPANYLSLKNLMEALDVELMSLMKSLSMPV